MKSPVSGFKFYMVYVAIFELAALILAVPMSYLMARIVIYYSKPNYRNQIDTEFQKEWNGKPSDEYYAWIRLRHRYLQEDCPPKFLKHITDRLSSVNKRDNLSGLSVNVKGEIEFSGGEKNFRDRQIDPD